MATIVRWFRARSRVVQLGLFLSVLGVLSVLWSVLVAIAGFLLRGVIWRWLKAKALAGLYNWAKRRLANRF